MSNPTFRCEMCDRIRPYAEQHELVSRYMTWFVCAFCHDARKNDDEYREATQLIASAKEWTNA